jgi:hypothetical protein
LERSISCAIAYRRHNGNVLRCDLINRRLQRRRALRLTPEREIDHIRRIFIQRCASHLKARRPPHPVDEITFGPATLANNANRKKARQWRYPSNTYPVAGSGECDSRNMRPMPVGVGRCAVVTEAPIRRLFLRDPVARIRRIGISPVTIIRHQR